MKGQHMFFRILARDLKRKKTMNIILLLFIIFASMFVASGLNNVITVMNGTDYYFDKAGVGDYVILTQGNDSVGHISKVLEKEKEVKSCRIEPMVFSGDKNVFLEDGTKAKTKNCNIYQSIDDSVITFFDMDNKPVTRVEKGHVYVTGQFLKENGLKSGDTIRVRHSGTELTLIVDGKAKDALLGSDFMGNMRFILNDGDMQTLLANKDIYAYYRGECAYIQTDDTNAVAAAAADIPCIGLTASRATFKMCYVMDMIVAFITLIMSVCLILVSFAVLRFSINFTITEEFREIGVMKAIGVKNRRIRSLYIIKYLMLSLLGAAAGFILSVPFGNKLLQSVSENMVLGNDYGIYINAAGALSVVLIICLFAWHCTGRVNRSSPVDAIRQGQTGERYSKKSVFRMGKSHMPPALFMAVNDVFSTPGRFLTIILSFFICTVFVLMMVNATNTIDSDRLIYSFGSAKSDLYVEDVSRSMELMHGSRADTRKYLDAQAKKLADSGIPASVSVEVWYKYKLAFKGRDYYLTFQQGIGRKQEDYQNTAGTTLQNEDEIAITPRISEMTGAKIGDTVTIDFGNEKRDCIVAAYYESMNQLGEIIRLYDTAPTDMKYVSSITQFMINFADSPSAEEIEQRKDKVREIFNAEKVMNAREYCVDCADVLDTMRSVQWMLLAITLVVVLLVTILMERAFISDEKSQIAILKAIGFKDRDIIRWHTMRFVITGIIAVLLAGVFSVPLTRLCISPIFGLMGTDNVEFNIVPVQVFIIYPAVVTASALIAAWITAQYTRTIKSSDTAYIE